MEIAIILFEILLAISLTLNVIFFAKIEKDYGMKTFIQIDVFLFFARITGWKFSFRSDKMSFRRLPDNLFYGTYKDFVKAVNEGNDYANR